ncbi:MAG TPA: YjbQ family protein [Thermoanaerobacterales bacterium]|uniref:secondary thiamine-phosphate synthase enzyme YjbQ n=1 Tax=Tepidanaerobacter sp. GT38 TaxID=2722793 RepID=UPI001839F7C9|nr:secondary thiamine-phosphate synthase enzyme YjbQ [Tepidanaerobacter sp. GT38]MCG1013352.1 YjbQ family protein [Tepidanaerobacter sp. GT38]HHY41757.1 YjbQ family protein [Thermoanaerobacterales bacterium]
MKTVTIETTERNQMIDITSIVQTYVRESGITDGVCYVYVPHTTAAVTINENSDPDVVRDVLNTLSKLIPYKDNYRHIEGNSDAHLKASLFGNTATVFVNNGRLVLGTWQSLFFCEFDGPRRRKVIIKVLGDK